MVTQPIDWRYQEIGSNGNKKSLSDICGIMHSKIRGKHSKSIPIEHDILKQFKVELVITLNELYTLFRVGYLAIGVSVINSPI